MLLRLLERGFNELERPNEAPAQGIKDCSCPRSAASSNQIRHLSSHHHDAARPHARPPGPSTAARLHCRSARRCCPDPVATPRQLLDLPLVRDPLPTGMLHALCAPLDVHLGTPREQLGLPQAELHHMRRCGPAVSRRVRARAPEGPASPILRRY